jgi:hypothetical protein
MYTNSVLAIVTASLAAGSAWAGSQLESRLSSCTTENCGGETIRATHQATEPFVTQIFARAGECLRLDVTDQSADVALVVVSPVPPAIVRNADRSAGDTRPLVKVDGLDFTGWYTVIVGFEGAGNTVVRFRMDYGRYPGGNANCAAAATTTAQRFERLVGDPAKVVAPAVDVELDAAAE